MAESLSLRRVLRRVWAGHSPRLGSLLSRVSVPVSVCTHTLSLGSSRWHPPNRSALGTGVFRGVGFPVCVSCVCVWVGVCPRRGECPAHTHLRRPPGLHAAQYTPTSIAHCPITPGPGLPTEVCHTRPPRAREGLTTHLLFIPAAPTTSTSTLFHGRAPEAPVSPAGKPGPRHIIG